MMFRPVGNFLGGSEMSTVVAAICLFQEEEQEEDDDDDDIRSNATNIHRWV